MQTFVAKVCHMIFLMLMNLIPFKRHGKQFVNNSQFYQRVCISLSQGSLEEGTGTWIENNIFQTWSYVSVHQISADSVLSIICRHLASIWPSCSQSGMHGHQLKWSIFQTNIRTSNSVESNLNDMYFKNIILKIYQAW